MPASPLPANAVEWELTNRRADETRHYQQTELSIEGEARLLSLARQLGSTLKEHSIEWARISAMMQEGAQIEWDYALEILGLVAEQAPEIVTETALLFLGIYPTNYRGEPNAKYEDERQFMAGAINLTRWVSMVEVFVQQNDYRRLAVPLGRATGMWNPPSASAAPSGPTGSSPEPSTT